MYNLFEVQLLFRLFEECFPGYDQKDITFEKPFVFEDFISVLIFHRGEYLAKYFRSKENDAFFFNSKGDKIIPVSHKSG